MADFNLPRYLLRLNFKIIGHWFQPEMSSKSIASFCIIVYLLYTLCKTVISKHMYYETC